MERFEIREFNTSVAMKQVYKDIKPKIYASIRNARPLLQL